MPYRKRVRMAATLAALQSMTALPIVAAAAAPETHGACRAAAHATGRADAHIAESYGHLPLSFEANAGQYDDDVRFLARGGGYALWLTPREAVLALGPVQTDAAAPDVLRMRVRGASTHALVTGEDRLAGVVNHFAGRDPSRWRTSVPTFAKVRYASVYPGVDLEYYGNQRQLEYDFVVAPGADPSVIAMEFPGAQDARIDADGSLVLGVAGREVRWNAPVAYQPVGGERRGVRGAYRLLADASVPSVGFTLAEFDRAAPLVIDPVMAYGTFLGGLEDDHAFSVAVDETGHAHVTGFTYAPAFPVLNAAQPALGGAQDAFVTKLTADGSALLFSTFFGGSAFDVGRGIALDDSGSIYFTGSTSSTDLAVTNGAYDEIHNGSIDVFVAKLDSAGALLWATYIGSTANEQGEDIAVHNSRPYVAGWTDSAAFPTTPGAYDTSYNLGTDAFVLRVNPTGTGLGYSTFLGASGLDKAYGIALSENEPYVTGYTNSALFPTPNGLDTTLNGATDAFVSHLSGSGAALLESTFVGGDGGEVGEDIALGGAGHVYTTGWTSSSNHPTTVGAYDVTYNGAVDAFVTKLDGALGSLTYSTYIGGAAYDTGHGIAVNSYGGALVTGFTASAANFPLVNATQPVFGGGTYDAFALRIAPTGTLLNFSTFLGGPGYDLGYEIALDGCGQPYVVGKAADGFPSTPTSFDPSWNGAGDGFVVKYEH
jgi:hypothetical protein